MPYVVKYKGEYYLHYANTKNGKAKLLKPDGKKFSGTPGTDKLEVVRTLKTKSFNGSEYCKTKVGVVSCSTGNIIKDSNVLALFEEKPKTTTDDICVRCRGNGTIQHYSHVKRGVCFWCKGTGLQSTGQKMREKK